MWAIVAIVEVVEVAVSAVSAVAGADEAIAVTGVSVKRAVP